MRRKKPAKFRPDAKPFSAHEAGKFVSRIQETPDLAQTPPSSATAARLDLRAALTSRQLQILGLMAEPLPNGEISTRLELEVTTIRKHIEHIFFNLGVRTRADAVACFLRRKNEQCHADRERLVREKRQLVQDKQELSEENARLKHELAVAREHHD